MQTSEGGVEYRKIVVVERVYVDPTVCDWSEDPLQLFQGVSLGPKRGTF